MGAKVTNNAWGKLSIPITSTATQILLSGGQGERFPNAVPGISWFYGTLIDEENNLEIVKCTKRSSDSLTVERGVDGTVARQYKAGDRFELRPCAALFEDKISADAHQKALDKLDTTLTKRLELAKQSMEDSLAQTKDEVVDALEREKAHILDTDKSGVVLKEDADKDYLSVKGGTMSGELKILTEGKSALSITGAVKFTSPKGSSAEVSMRGYNLTLETIDSKNGEPAGGNIDIGGDLKAKTVHVSSDSRLKDNVRPLEPGEAYDLVKRLSPVHFKWLGSGTEDLGLIAQDLQKVLPQAVMKDSCGFLSVNYVALAALALAAIKDIQSKLEE